MLQIEVDGLAGERVPPAENWGQLLDSIEQGHGAARRVVTAVRFGGVALPTFRGATALDQRLPAAGTIAVETSSVDDLLRESALAALASIAPLQRAATRVAARFRTGGGTMANRDLSQLTLSLHSLTSVTALLAKADPKRSDAIQAIELLVPTLTRAMDKVIACQSGADWVGLADVLEGDLTHALDDWASVLVRVWGR